MVKASGGIIDLALKSFLSDTNRKLILLGFFLLPITQNLYAQNEGQEVNTAIYSLDKVNKSWDRFSVNLGGFFASYSSGILLRSQQLGLGFQIDLEDALGLETSVFAMRGAARYRIGKTRRHSLTLGYFGINRNAIKTLEKDLELGDDIFPIGTEINSKFNLSIVRVKYDYAIYQDERVSIGASLGLFIMRVNLTVKAMSFEEHTTSFVAPLPLIGMRTDFQISPKLYLNQSVEFLYLSFPDFKGGLLDLSVFVEHKTFKNIAFGLGVNSNRLNISIEKPDSSIEMFGDIRMDYTGLLLFGKYYF